MSWKNLWRSWGLLSVSPPRNRVPIPDPTTGQTDAEAIGSTWRQLLDEDCMSSVDAELGIKPKIYLTYDKLGDTLHVSFGRPKKPVTVLTKSPTLMVGVNPETGQVVGFTIANFASGSGLYKIELAPGQKLAPF